MKNRRMRTRMYGGVRGRKNKESRKKLENLCFPPTRLYTQAASDTDSDTFESQLSCAAPQPANLMTDYYPFVVIQN